MANKVIIGLLIFLVVLSGGLGYYSYTLGQQISYLDETLTRFQAEQTSKSSAINDELTALRKETLNMAGDLGSKIDRNLAQIDLLGDETEKNLARVDALEDKADETLAKVDTLGEEIKNITELSPSIIDATELYQKASQATVRISDGERTAGSGFIFDGESRVVTAYHVIQNLSDIYVVLPDGRTSKAVSSSSSPHSDVAVLTLEDSLDIEPLALADSASVKVGEPVATIGNPFDLAETLTTGIVSQTGRFAEIEYDTQTRWIANLIQFDAAVNFGNSGCPLLDSDGKVIGLVIARIEPNEGDGIHYAVSSNKVNRVVTSLIAKGSFDYPWLGIGITNLTPRLAESRDLETLNGVLVEGVFPGSPAAVAGIQADDIIIAIDSTGLRSVAELTSYLGEYRSPGNTVTVTLIRGTTRLELPLEIGKAS